MHAWSSLLLSLQSGKSTLDTANFFANCTILILNADNHAQQTFSLHTD